MNNSIKLFNGSQKGKNKYDDLTDEQIIEIIRNERSKDKSAAERYLYAKYSYVVRNIVSSFYINDGGKDDLFQEAMIGFIRAVNGYDLNRNISFKYFAQLCVKRQIISVIRKANTYNSLNSSISLSEHFGDDENMSTFYDCLYSEDENPEQLFISKEQQKEYFEFAKEILSGFEINVLKEYGKGTSYEEIAITLNKDIKSVDNALQRIKKKITKYKDKIAK